MNKKNPLIKRYGAEARWVNFRIQERKGKITKIPYSPKTKKMASSTEANDWTTYEQAAKVSEQVGIVFTPEKLMLGIDIDHCLKKGTNNITHEDKETIAALIIEADTYTEISPSGEGLHLYFELSEPLELSSNKSAPYEAYTEGRYFTFTGNAYKTSRPVRKLDSADALQLLSIIGYPWNIQSKQLPNTAQSVSYPVEGTNDALHHSVLSDEDVIGKMFMSKGGKKIKELFEGSLKEYENDNSRADMALLAHLAFWCRKDFDQMKRIWLKSPLAKRDKTQKRADYQNRSINAAIYNCTAIYETPAIKMKEEHPDLDLLFRVREKGEIEYLMNTENMYRILARHKDFAGRFRYDEFKNTYEILDSNQGRWRVLEEADIIATQTQISIVFADWFGGVQKHMVYDGIVKISKQNAIDSARDYIEAITWDGEKRLDHWLHHTYGVAKDKYHTAVASNWIKGMIKRIFEPACKFDFVLVLEGEQGSKKSTSLAVLGGEWHLESAMSTESKDFFMQFQGKAIVEFSEGETLSRTEVKRMKAIISMPLDKYRPPYERVSQEFPRRCVFAMTTNQEEYLKDETGNRRWLPVKLMKEADVEWLKANRDQLFAEAYQRVIIQKEKIYEFPKDETMWQQQQRQISDPNEGVIVEWYLKLVKDEDQKNGVTISRAFKEALHGGFASRSMNKFEEMSIANIFKKTLKLEKVQKSMSGVRMSVWVNTGKPMREEDETEMDVAIRTF